MASPFENADTTHSTPQSIPSPKGATAHDDLDKQQSALGTTNSVHVNADLYRTLSPTDVAMWDLKDVWGRNSRSGSGLSKSGSGFFGKVAALFGKPSS